MPPTAGQTSPAACVVSARRAGTTAALDQLVKYPMISNMPVVSSQYWPMVHGACPEDAAQDAEGLQTMRQLARNLLWLVQCIAAGDAGGVARPEMERAHSPISSADFRQYDKRPAAAGNGLRRLVSYLGKCAQPCFFTRRLPVMCSTVRHSTVVRGMTAVENGKSGARYCAMSARSACSLPLSGTTVMRP